jgi:putative phosphoribosyl transferase
MTTLAEHALAIPIEGGVELQADFIVPSGAAGLVVFAHGSGSGRHSPRNRLVARYLNTRHFATVLADLLTAEEERIDQRTGHLRFDVGLLAERLLAVTRIGRSQEEVVGLPTGYFGASTGAAAALIAAAVDPDVVSAVVSRGGRPDLAGDYLERVQAPTLLIVGGRDDVVIELNQKAQQRLRAPSELVIVPNATHLFEEPGALEEVARLAGDWFLRHLAGKQQPA